MSNPVSQVRLLYGILGALVAVAVQIWLSVTDVNQLFGGAETIIQVASFVVGAILYLFAGRAAAAAMGKISSGVLAGLLADLIAGLIGNIDAVVFFSPVGKCRTIC